ncbi:hypothetical protein K0U00_29090, partial [Paenibacillus sepulcri]|nr:hypothetical protein [Paenibacillus sepulcri]
PSRTPILQAPSRLKNIPLPAAAGTSQSLTVPLPGDTRYYLAMKTKDDANLVSAISNAASGTTLLLPVGTNGMK